MTRTRNPWSIGASVPMLSDALERWPIGVRDRRHEREPERARLPGGANADGDPDQNHRPLNGPGECW